MDWLSTLRKLRAMRVSALAPTPGASGSITAQADGDTLDVRVIGEMHWMAGLDVLPVAEELMRDRPKAVQLYVDTPGGDLFDAMALRAALDASGATITATAGAVVASAGVPVFLAASERAAQSYTRFMVHQPRGGFFSFGTLDEISAALDEYRPTFEAAEGLYRDTIASVIDGETVDGWLAAGTDTWLTAEEASEHGLVTAIAAADKDDDKPDEAMQALVRARFMALSRHYMRASR